MSSRFYDRNAYQKRLKEAEGILSSPRAACGSQEPCPKEEFLRRRPTQSPAKCLRTCSPPSLNRKKIKNPAGSFDLRFRKFTASEKETEKKNRKKVPVQKYSCISSNSHFSIALPQGKHSNPWM